LSLTPLDERTTAGARSAILNSPRLFERDDSRSTEEFMADRDEPRPHPQSQPQAQAPPRETAEQRRARHTAEAIAKQADLKREAAERRARKSRS
jgi:hypothetical protein